MKTSRVTISRDDLIRMIVKASGQDAPKGIPSLQYDSATDTYTVTWYDYEHKPLGMELKSRFDFNERGFDEMPYKFKNDYPRVLNQIISNLQNPLKPLEQ